jgi:hypothetical protein
MTPFRKELNEKIKISKDKRPINQMGSGSIIWFLIRRHNDHIVIFGCTLLIGLVWGSKL